MEKYDIFMREGVFWFADFVEKKENKSIRWTEIKASWSGFGPRPVFADDVRTFIERRQRKSDGHWIN